MNCMFLWAFNAQVATSPPHLCTDAPRCSPVSSLVRPLPLVCWPRLALPPRRQSAGSGWNAAAGEVAFCGHRD